MRSIFIIIILLIIAGCNSNATGGNDKCSTKNPKGKCENNQICLSGNCIDQTAICSNENLTGLCETGLSCINGKCKNGNPCSTEHPDGLCSEGKVCENGNCVDITYECSTEHPDGLCSEGKVCENGVCVDVIYECSLEHPNGVCLTNSTCVDGKCVLNSQLCSQENLTGICPNDEYCSLGICLPVECKNGEVKKCYPSNNSEIGKGICREGVQLCEENKWGICVGAITPRNEECNGIDDNCNLITDEGVKNDCGTCGTVPVEIIGNNFDDDCDGKIDEDENNQGGLEGCDGRTDQPCYTGPAGTAGKGICKGGQRDCLSNNTWGICEGQILPQTESCNDGIDNDCDGYVDEYCDTPVCLEEELCDNYKDDDCDNLINEGCQVIDRKECVANEICNDGFDNDCNGLIDEGCSCNGLTELSCYSGDPSNLNEGTECSKGIMTCIGGEYWGNCVGEKLPTYEICDGKDNNCNGENDEESLNANACGICLEITPVEICHDGIDNDCDELTDENCPVFCVAQPEVCDNADNDCDGLIDEGVLNSCGKCGESCYVEEVSGEDDFNQGTFDGVSNTDNPNEITLDSSTIQNNFIWIANSGANSVHKINTITGEKFGPFSVGSSPSRTAVDLDGSVWVANRNSANITKLDVNGNHVCTVSLHSSCAPRGIAIDKNREVWVGCGNWLGNVLPDGWIYKIKLLSSPENPENPNSICKIISLGSPSDVDGGLAFKGAQGNMIYGLAIDKNGILWTSPGTAGSARRYITRINTNLTPANSEFFKSWNMTAHEYYGIVIDSNDDVWYGLYGNSSKSQAIARVHYNSNNQTISETLFAASTSTGDLSNGRGVAIDADGNIWAAYSGSNRIAKFNSSGVFLADYSSQDPNTANSGITPIGVGIDSDGNVWINNNSSNDVIKMSKTGQILGVYSVGSAPYTYSDMTGFNLRYFVSPSGSFKTILDMGRNDAIYDSVSWQGETPNGSSISIRARVSNDRNKFALPEGNANLPVWSDWITTSGSSLIWANPANKIGRYIQLEIKLQIGATSDDKPILRGVVINWQRP